jgi:hypothetical protein
MAGEKPEATGPSQTLANRTLHPNRYRVNNVSKFDTVQIEKDWTSNMHNSFETAKFDWMMDAESPAEMFARLVLPQTTPCLWCAWSFKDGKPIKPTWVDAGDWRAIDAASKASSDAGLTAYIVTAGIDRNNKGSNGKRSFKGDYIIAKRCLQIDIDIKPGFVQSQIEALASLKRLCVALGIPGPTLVLSSGGGLHCYWCFDADTADLSQWSRMSKGLLAGARSHAVELTGDPGKWTTRGALLRWPGTVNTKTDTQRPVEILWDHSSVQAHPLATFTPLAALAPKIEPSNDNGVFSGDDDEIDWIRAALRKIDASDYDKWFRTSCSLHHHFAGSDKGLAVFVEWSSTAHNYEGHDRCEIMWNTWSTEYANPRTIMSVYGDAKVQAWEPPISAEEIASLEPAVDFGDEPDTSLLEDDSQIDLQALIDRRNSAMIAGVLLPGNLFEIYGAPKCGKTFFTMDMFYAVGQGREWHGRKVKQAPILYVSLEGNEGFRERMLALRKVHGPAPWFNRCRPHISLVMADKGKEGVAMIVKAAKQLAVKTGMPLSSVIIVIDTLARVIAGDNENATDVMTSFAENRCGEIKRQTGGASVGIVHHTNAAGNARGSGVIAGACDVVIRIEAHRDEATKKVVSRSASIELGKDVEEGHLLLYTLKPVEIWRDATDPAKFIAPPVVVRLETPSAGKGADVPESDELILKGLAAWVETKPGPTAMNTLAKFVLVTSDVKEDTKAVQNCRRHIQRMFKAYDKARGVSGHVVSLGLDNGAILRWEPVIDDKGNWGDGGTVRVK